MEKKEVKELVNMLDCIKGVSFVSLVYTNKYGEKARYILNVGIKHRRVLERDLESIKKLRTTLYPELAKKYGEKVARVAFDEMETSLAKSLEGTNERSQAQIDLYMHLNSGIKLNLKNYELYLHGYLVSKKVLEKGEYKVVQSKEKTLCKNEIGRYLKGRRYRQFKFDGTECFSTGGKKLIIESA